MRGLGMSRAEVAAEMSRRYRLRPRAAWRTAWGWTLDEAADRYNALRASGGQDIVASLSGSRLSEWENWPLSPRKPPVTGLCLLAEIYQCAVLDLIDLHDREKLTPAELITVGKTAAARPAAGRHQACGEGRESAPSLLPGVDAGVIAGVSSLGSGSGLAVVRPGPMMAEVPGRGGWAEIRELVMAAAEESGERAAREAGMLAPAPRVEQVRQDVWRLARTYSVTAPVAFLAEARSVRDQAWRLAERTRRPGQLAELYAVAGQACALMSVASFDLAVWPAAIEQAHAALGFGEMARHPALQGWALGMQGLIAYWRSRPQDATEAVAAGLAVAPPGTARARLYCISARAWSHLGASGRVREALGAADRERDTEAAGGDELHDVIGGEFGWGPARQAMCSASALLRIGDPDGAAIRAAEAIRLHSADQAGGIVHLKARADLAQAELARGRLDAAEDALAPVWSLPAAHRRHSLVGRLDGIAGALGGARYLKAGGAAGLAERIRVFAAESAPRALPPAGELPGPGGE